MLVIVWVTFLFGSGLPILFPIAFFGLVVLYVTNRVMLAYLCRRPPSYDEKMNETTITLLNFAPWLYVTVGAWVYSNPATFYNHVEPMTGSMIFMPSNHYFTDFWNRITPGSVFFVFLLFLLVIWLLRLTCGCCRISWCLSVPERVDRMPVQ